MMQGHNQDSEWRVAKHTIDLLFRVLQKNDERLFAHIRDKEFTMLTDGETQHIKITYRSLFSNILGTGK